MNKSTYTPDVFFEHVPTFKEGKKEVKEVVSPDKTEEKKQKEKKGKLNE